MHLPPAVSYPVVRSRWHLFGIGSLAVLGSLVNGALVWHQWWQAGASLCLVLFALIAPVSVIGAVAAWYKGPVGRLHWDGLEWFWRGVDQAQIRQIQQVSIALDFQFLVLVQLRCETARSQWIFLQEGTDRSQWLALRRALVSSGSDRAPVHRSAHKPADDDLLGTAP